jgi:hypothetical protein
MELFREQARALSRTVSYNTSGTEQGRARLNGRPMNEGAVGSEREALLSCHPTETPMERVAHARKRIDKRAAGRAIRSD